MLGFPLAESGLPLCGYVVVTSWGSDFFFAKICNYSLLRFAEVEQVRNGLRYSAVYVAELRPRVQNVSKELLRRLCVFVSDTFSHSLSPFFIFRFAVGLFPPFCIYYTILLAIYQ